MLPHRSIGNYLIGILHSEFYNGEGDTDDKKKITIVQMNDSHAYLETHPELFWEGGRAVYRPAGGYARIATLLKQIRADNPEQVLFLDGGDTFHGTYPALHSRGEVLVPILNALSPAAMTAHWEFAYSPQGFKTLSEHITYPVLAMNVYHKDSRERLFKPYEVIEMAGLRVGVAGIACNIVDKAMPPEFSEGVYFTNGLEELPEIVRILRNQEKVDLVVMLSHLGLPQDMHLLEKVPGVDVALSAHTHHRLNRAIRQGDALVVQSGSHGSFITRLDLTLEDGQITDYDHQLIEVSQSIDPDAEVEDLVETAIRPYRLKLEEVVGKTFVPLDRGLNLEATMDNFLLTTLLNHTGADLALSNGWRYGAPIVPGPILMNDLYNIVPMNPPVSTVEITGQELRMMLEKNLEHTFSRDPLNQMGGYVKRALGIRAMIKVENPPLTRIQKLFVGDREVEADKVYQVAFINSQGVPANIGENRQEHSEKMIDVMVDYLKNYELTDAKLRGTFTLI